MKEQAIKAYQDNEAYQEAIRQQSMEKDQLLKDMENTSGPAKNPAGAAKSI